MTSRCGTPQNPDHKTKNPEPKLAESVGFGSGVRFPSLAAFAGDASAGPDLARSFVGEAGVFTYN